MVEAVLAQLDQSESQCLHSHHHHSHAPLLISIAINKHQHHCIISIINVLIVVSTIIIINIMKQHRWMSNRPSLIKDMTTKLVEILLQSFSTAVNKSCQDDADRHDQVPAWDTKWAFLASFMRSRGNSPFFGTITRFYAGSLLLQKTSILQKVCWYSGDLYIAVLLLCLPTNI